MVGKERISPWDLIEGYRNEVSTKWSMFQAIKIDFQPETIVQQLTKLMSHDHHQNFRRPLLPGDDRTLDHFLAPLQVQVRMIKACVTNSCL